MVLATCGYMLDPVLAELRRREIAYHNPFRAASKKWNPLPHVQAVLNAFAAGRRGLRRENVREWLPKIRVRGLLRCTLARALEICESQPDGELAREEIAEIFTEEGLRFARRGDIEDFLKRKRKGQAGQWRYAARLIQAGNTDPRVIVGTVHSVKGGEADTVILLPYLSPAGAREWAVRSDRIYRLLYVAVTRARERLILVKAPNGGPQIQWEVL